LQIKITMPLDFTRIGAVNVSAYVPNPSGSVIAAPSAPTLFAWTMGNIEFFIRNGRLFNEQATIPNSQRSVRVAYASYNKFGDLTWTAFTNAVTITPVAGNNVLEVRLSSVPALAIYVLVTIDDVLAGIVPTIPKSRRNGTAGLTQSIIIPYEPNANVITRQELDDNRSSLSPLEFKAIPLGLTTGASTHSIEYTKVDIPVNDLPNEMYTTRSMQKINLTLKAPPSKYEALFGGGTAYNGCSLTCATSAVTQLGFKGGSCDDNRVFQLTLPGDACNAQLDALLYAKATHGDASQEVNFSSEEAAHLPVVISEASSSLFKGQHSLTQQVI